MQTNIQHTPTRDHAAAVPLGDFDVVEDGNTLVNRLYYAVPKFEEGQFSCSFFYEENTFHILMHLLDQTAILQQKLQIGSPYFFYSELQQLFFRKGQFRLQ